MINLRATIIATVRAILPTLAMLALAPWIINSAIAQRWQQSLTNLQPWFIALHGLLYLTLIVLWPRLIKRIQAQSPLNSDQIKTALNSRWYLLAVFLFIDALMLRLSL